MFVGPCIIVITEELKKNQLDATCYFIVLLIGSRCPKYVESIRNRIK